MLVNRKPNKAARLAKNSKIIKAIIQAIQEKKGEKIISLDLRKIPEAVADFFIVCEAGSTTQVRAVADFIEMEVKEKCSEGPYMHEGRQVLQWVIIDYINVVVHIMLPDSRRFYKLEEMWSDAVMEEHEG
jgi:ribosome-associated protein